MLTTNENLLINKNTCNPQVLQKISRFCLMWNIGEPSEIATMNLIMDWFGRINRQCIGMRTVLQYSQAQVESIQ